MESRTLSIGITSLALLAGACGWAFAQQEQPSRAAAAPRVDEDEGEDVISLDKAPEAVRRAAIKLAGGANRITRVTREEDEEDVVVYEIEYTDGATSCSAVFSEAGELMEAEREIAAASLPATALRALREEFPDATFADVQFVTKMYYEVEAVIGGESHEVVVDAAGNIEDDCCQAGDGDHDEEHADHEHGDDEHHGGKMHHEEEDEEDDD